VAGHRISLAGFHKLQLAFVCCIGRIFVVVEEDVGYRMAVLSEEDARVGKSLVLLAE
jgi:hypothetical protein